MSKNIIGPKGHERKKHTNSKNDNLEQDSSVKDFVQDNFFEKGYLWLKVRQILVNLFFLLVLFFPIFILFNSILKNHILKYIYYWNYKDGFELTNYLKSFILLAFVFILVCSLAFLYRNNWIEQRVYPNKKTYNEKKLEERKIILNAMYNERFGEKEIRETTKYYVVDGEQNLPDHFVSDLFKAKGVEIK